MRLLLATLALAIIGFFIGYTESYAASPRIGFLSPGTPENTASVLAGLRQGLRDNGYVEGTNIAIESRFAGDQLDRLPDLSRELIGLPVDVLVTFVTQATLAAQGNTRTIPIVMIGVSDPIGSKLVSSLSHPGGNITGTSGMYSEGAGKRLQLLKEVAPDLQSVVVMWNPHNRVFQSQMIRETEAAAKRLGVRLKMHEAYDDASIAHVLSTLSNERGMGLDILPDITLGSRASTIAAWAEKARLPSIGGGGAFADAGGLMGYGPNLGDLARIAGGYVAKILRGAKPADLPVEQPTTFELVVNLKTARQIGLTIPNSVRARADRLID